MIQSPALVAAAQPGAASTDTASSLPIALQYWNIFWRRRLIMALVLVLALLAGVAITVLAIPQFSSAAQIEIARESDQVTKVDGLEAKSVGQSQEFYATQYQLLRSRSLSERVARELNLGRSPEFFAAHDVDINSIGEGGAALNRSGSVNSEQLRRRERAAAGLLRGHVEINPVRGSSLVNIEYTSADATISARVANAWSEQFIQASIDRRFASTAEARRFLETRLTDLRERLDASERELVEYAVRQNIIILEESTDDDGKTRTTSTLTSINLQEWNRQLAAATSVRLRAEGVRQALASRRDNDSTVSNNTLSALRQRRAEKSAELSALLVRFEADYPPAKALQEQIVSLDAAIAGEQRRTLTASSAELDAAVRQENELRGRVDRLTSQLSDQERASTQFNILQREVDTNRQLYDALLQRYKEIGVAGVAANNIAVVDQATPASAPSSPNIFLNMAIALLAGISLAAVVAITLENLDEGIRDPSTVRQLLGAPLLGVVPAMEVEDIRADVSDPKSISSEAYVTIRSNLSFSTDHGVPATFMVTSSSQAEGKSTTAYALAAVLGRVGRSVLLIDADMRLPTLDRYLEKRGATGLSNYLSGDDEFEKMLLPTPLDNVLAMVAGPIPPSAAELLSSDRLERLIQAALERFDHIIVDCPPMLELADATLVSRSVEGVVYVVEANRGSSRAIASSVNRLRNAQARIFGVVLAKYSAERSGYGYGYGGNYKYYRYGGASEDAEDGDTVPATGR